jgi:hypothetical protein
VIAHRRLRSVHLGEHITLQFEDEQTIRRQIQEMLHIEKIFDEAGIQGEIDAYAPLVPDGCNWKATMLIEYPDPNERKRELSRLIGVEDRMFVEVEGHRRRRPGPRERREDVVGALPALRALGRGLPGGAGRCGRATGMRPHPLPGTHVDPGRHAGQPGG